MEPSAKSPAMTEFLEGAYGRTTAIKGSKCIPEPIGCGREIPASEIVGTWDSLTTREYQLSGMCKTCQDAFYDCADDYADDAEWKEGQETAWEIIGTYEPIPGITVI